MSPAAGGSSSHSNLEKIKYDVFISFRGEDTRSTFTSHLHHVLCQAKIKAFIDEDDLEKGHEISPTFKKAIEESKLCLVILSEHYATSRWCLEELVHILNFKGQAEVLPVFYKVDPSDVRKQQKSYKAAFDGLRRNHLNSAKLQKWRDALTKIADRSGWASNKYRDESQLIVTIVRDVNEKLKDMSVASDELQGLVGIDEKIKEIEQLLQIGSSNVRPIGIWGPGGIGKTTLADAVCKRLSFHFETCVFLNNVREKSKDLLKKELFSELLEGESRARFARDRIRCKKVLVVFDDVDDADQCGQFITGGWFGTESRIIITSRDKQVLRNIGVIEPYEVEGLDDADALVLFSLHAFKNSPTANRKELSERVVSYAGGIPLALKDLGCHLFSKDIKVWESTLDKLEKFPNKSVERVLRISYDALDDTQKEIFLDIALFLKGEKRDLVQEILDDCDLYATEGIEVLIDKALITVDRRWNIVKMHSLLQIMAFQIVRPQSTNQDPRKGSRLLNAEDFNQALKNDRGLETIEGISLDTSNCNREICLLPTTFSKMYRLRLLKISGSKLCLPQGPPAFPDTLRYLYWNSYPLKSLSTNFIPEKLVELDMGGSQLEKLWEGAPNLVNLKSIDLSDSMHLTQVPDLSQALNIKRVILWFCPRLTEVPSYFQLLTELKTLSLIGCPSLSKLSGLPKSLTKLRVLTKPFEHDMSNCRARSSSKLERFPRILEPMEFLEHLLLEFAAIKELPFSMKNLTGLKILSLKFCQNLEFLPDSIHSLSSLQKLDIGFCRKLESLPVLPSSLSKLDARFCTSLKTMSSSIPLVKQNWDDFYNRGYDHEELIFLGCEMLDENARKVIMDEALFRVLRLATLRSKYGYDGSKFYLGLHRSCWPGSEIPRWFSHKSDESSICLNLPHPDCWYNSSSYLGLAFCLILEFKNHIICPSDHIIIRGESVYMFPNGDLWKQRRPKSYYISFQYRHSYISRSCNFSYDNTTKVNIGGAIRFEYLYVFMDNTYGEFLRSNNGQIDSHGNKFPRTATVDFQDSEEFGEYIKLAEEGRCNDANGITGFTTPTATASFFFSLDERYEKHVEIKKCGVHLLYTQEADGFGYVRQIVSESSGDHEAVYSSE